MHIKRGKYGVTHCIPHTVGSVPPFMFSRAAGPVLLRLISGPTLNALGKAGTKGFELATAPTFEHSNRWATSVNRTLVHDESSFSILN